MTSNLRTIGINRGNSGQLGDDRRDRGQQQDHVFIDRLRFQTPGPSHRDKSFG